MSAVMLANIKMRGRHNAKGLGCEGSAAAEFALLIPLLLVLIVGVYEFGRLYWIQNTLQYAAEQSGRCVMVNKTVASVTGGSCAPSNYSGGMAVTVPTPTTATCNGANGLINPAPSCMTIQVTYSYSFSAVLAPLIGMAAHRSSSLPASITLTGQSIVPVS
jgi:Flp pilus assembly protein TadG